MSTSTRAEEKPATDTPVDTQTDTQPRGDDDKVPRLLQRFGRIAAPVVFAALFLAPLPLTEIQHRLAAIFAAVVVLWFTEAIPLVIAALLGVAAMVIFGVGDVDTIVAEMGSDLILTFVGAFLIARAMLVHGVSQRIAFSILRIRWVGRQSWRLVAAVGLASALLSTVVSNTATVAMLLPTCLGLTSTVRKLTPTATNNSYLRFGVAILLALTYGSSVGGMLTPIGSPPNLIGISIIEDATGTSIGFLEWMLITAPVSAILFVLMVVVITALNRPEVRELSGVRDVVDRESEHIGPMTPAAWNTVFVLGLTVILWVLPSIAGLIAGTNSDIYTWLDGHLNIGAVAILGSSLLFMLPARNADRTFTLTWSQAKDIDWGMIMLFAAALALGAALDNTGLATAVGEGFADLTGVSSPILITATGVALALVMSELASNTASAAVIVPVVLPIAVASGVDTIPVGMAATLAATLGFMLPVSTTQNLVVFGSGQVPLTRMIRTGFVFGLITIVVTVVVVPYTIAAAGLS